MLSLGRLYRPYRPVIQGIYSDYCKSPGHYLVKNLDYNNKPVIQAYNHCENHCNLECCGGNYAFLPPVYSTG